MLDQMENEIAPLNESKKQRKPKKPKSDLAVKPTIIKEKPPKAPKLYVPPKEVKSDDAAERRQLVEQLLEIAESGEAPINWVESEPIHVLRSKLKIAAERKDRNQFSGFVADGLINGSRILETGLTFPPVKHKLKMDFGGLHTNMENRRPVIQQYTTQLCRKHKFDRVVGPELMLGITVLDCMAETVTTNKSKSFLDK